MALMSTSSSLLSAESGARPADYAEHLLSPTLSTIDGVAQVNIFGAKRYAVRVRVNPQALALARDGDGASVVVGHAAAFPSSFRRGASWGWLFRRPAC